jgi:hypothetical protein
MNLSSCSLPWAHLPHWKIGLEGIRFDLFRETIASGGIRASELPASVAHPWATRPKDQPPWCMPIPQGLAA